MSDTKGESGRAGRVKISIDKTTCIACGVCNALCPSLFRLKPDGAEVIGEVESKEDLECAKEAEFSCPTGALKVETVGTDGNE